MSSFTLVTDPTYEPQMPEEDWRTPSKAVPHSSASVGGHLPPVQTRIWVAAVGLVQLTRDMHRRTILAQVLVQELHQTS